MTEVELGTPVGELRNLGPTSAGWLQTVRIATFGNLEAVGAVEAYHLVRAAGFNGTLNLLYAIQSTLLGIDWQDLPDEERARLRDAI